MRSTRLDLSADFAVVAGNPRSQAAVMVLQPGESTGAPHNEHAGSDQWLYVIAGRGRATVGDRSVELERGSLLLVEQGEPHAIDNTGDEALQTLNVYVPPAYRPDGELLGG